MITGIICELYLWLLLRGPNVTNLIPIICSLLWLHRIVSLWDLVYLLIMLQNLALFLLMLWTGHIWCCIVDDWHGLFVKNLMLESFYCHYACLEWYRVSFSVFLNLNRLILVSITVVLGACVLTGARLLFLPALDGICLDCVNNALLLTSSF